MTTKERTEHAKEISNKYVPRISPNNTEIMSEIKKLPIQDIITIHSNAEYALNKGLLGMFAADPNIKDITTLSSRDRYIAAIEHVRQIIIDRLKTADVLWTVTDRITCSPFIDDINNVWVFSEKELADECVDYYMQQYRTTFEITEIKKDDIVKFFGQTAYMKGAECFRVDMGGYAGMQLKAEWLIEKPNFKNTPEINRPVMNPDLFRAVAKLQEERLYRTDYDGKKEKLHQFEDDMIKAFHNAKFLIPVKGMDSLKENTENTGKNGEVVLQRGSTISIPTLTKGEGDDAVNATPVFTDWEEFHKMYPDSEWGGWIWKAEELLSAPDDVICLNVSTLCFEMSKNMIQQMLDIWSKEFDPKRTLNKDELPADFQPYVKAKPENEKSGGIEAVNNAIKALNKEISSLPNTLIEFMDNPHDMSKDGFFKKYGAEKVFKLIGYNKEKDKWTLSHSPKFRGIWSEGAYFTYEDAVTALMERNVDCPINKWVPKQWTVKQMLDNSWTIRFIRNDGKILIVEPKGDKISISTYTQKELLDKLVSKYDGQTIIADDFYKNMEEIYLDDIILWVLAKPNTAMEVGKWTFRKNYRYKNEGPYNNEYCIHIFSTYEEAAKEIEEGYYPQKTTLYQELSNYTDKPHILFYKGKEVLFVPKKMAEAKSITADVQNNIENNRIENDIVSYLKDTDMSEKNIEKTVSKFKNHEDVFKAFHSYIMTMEYSETPIVEGYSPKSLHEEVGDKLSPIGIMNYIIYLREEPEEAIKDLKAGLPRK